jgi:4-aminobutyrate aminotransferase-like enzyme
MISPPPGPISRRLSNRLRDVEAPGINTLYKGQDNILWSEACGSNVLDVDGNRYIDFTSSFGVAALGHRHPAVVSALKSQAGKLIHGLGDAAGHELRIDLADRLCQLAPVEDAQVYYAISGADAVEIALKTGQLATGRRGVLVFDPAYHGLTLGALAATSRPLFRQPFVEPLDANFHRLPFACDPQQIADMFAANSEIGTLLLEPIVGREGILLPPQGWLTEVARCCQEHQVLWIADEIFTAFGRTGYLFAVEAEGVRPDLLCCGKALAGGLPIGLVVGRRDLMAAWATPGEARHTATFVANPLACKAALVSLEILIEQDLAGRANRLGKKLGDRIASWRQQFSSLIDTRGRGFLWGLEFCSATLASNFTLAARDRGVLLLAGGPDGRVAQIVPPLTIHQRQLCAALDLLENSLHEIEFSNKR